MLWFNQETTRRPGEGPVGPRFCSPGLDSYRLHVLLRFANWGAAASSLAFYFRLSDIRLEMPAKHKSKRVELSVKALLPAVQDQDFETPDQPPVKRQWNFDLGQKKFDEQRRQIFLDMLSECGNKMVSARSAGVCPSTVAAHIKADPEFAQRVQNSLGVFCGKLEAEVYRRAVVGYEEPVRNNKGEIVGTVRRFSDRLLELYVKRHMSEYREKLSADVNVTGGVLVVGGNMLKTKDWEEKYAKQEQEAIDV